MYFHDSQCCAIQEIGGLSEYDDPKVAMTAFCRKAVREGVSYYNSNFKKGTLYSYYLFTAAVLKDEKTPYVTHNLYGHDFANFIKENKLGEVWQSPARVNDGNHPDHKNVVWIWMPNTKAVYEWWNANCPKELQVARAKKFFTHIDGDESGTWVIETSTYGRWGCYTNILGKRGCGRNVPSGEVATFRYGGSAQDGSVLCSNCHPIPKEYYEERKPRERVVFEPKDPECMNCGGTHLTDECPEYADFDDNWDGGDDD